MSDYFSAADIPVVTKSFPGDQRGHLCAESFEFLRVYSFHFPGFFGYFEPVYGFVESAVSDGI